MKLQRLAGLAAAGLITLTAACGQGAPSASPSDGGGAGAPSASGSPSDRATGPVEVTDARGSVTIPADPQHIVATDNRIFETLSAWDVTLAAAPVRLIPGTIDYKKDTAITDLGSHREPNLEAVVAVEPDLILNGQRFAQYYDDFKKLAPSAAIVDTSLDEAKPLDEELRRLTTMLGTIFGKPDESAKLVADFDASIDRVKSAYDAQQKVMAVITSGGEINYAAPSSGRALGPVFDILGLTPALETEGSADHQGDDISVEAIAQSNPDWILVMDRDAAVSGNKGEKYTPANELLANSAALSNVTAVKEQGRIIYMPQDTYINEGIQTYTEFFNHIADALEQAK